MTTTKLIEKLRDLAKIGIVNAKEDSEVLMEAADRLFTLRAKADPRWDEWLILDEGLFLGGMTDGEADMTMVKDEAISFGKKEDAEAYLETITDELGGGCVVLRGDVDAGGLDIEFFYE